VWAQKTPEKPKNLTEMSLEDLLNVQVTSVSKTCWGRGLLNSPMQTCFAKQNHGAVFLEK
jgi:hypothetical protein